jgi:hypothetical protein
MNAARSLNFLLNDPEGWFEIARAEIVLGRYRAKSVGKKLEVRWHDAGDFFSKEYADLTMDLARSLPDIKFYAYTKVADVAIGDRPPNMEINFSAGAQRSQEKKIEFYKSKGNIPKEAIVVLPNMFKDLLARQAGGRKQVKDETGQVKFKDAKSIDTLRQRLAQEYDIEPDTIITYNQMMSMPVGTEPKWNVIVPSGSGDRAAIRRDVIISFLLQHK